MAADLQRLARYSRQNVALGAQTTAKLAEMRVVVVGCRGVGIETAKNLALQGIGAVTLVDPSPATPQDSGSNFFLFAGDSESGAARA